MNDLDARLRAAYRAVAEQTVVAEHHAPLHTVEPSPLPRERSHHRVLAGLAVAASLLIALVVVLVTRHPAEPADTHTATERTIAVPTYRPAGLAYHEASRDDTGAHLDFRAGSQGLVITSGVDASVPLQHAHTVVLLSGVAANVEVGEGSAEVRWALPDGRSFAVIGSYSETELLRVANGLWYVTPEMFDQLNRYTGFLSLDEEMKVVDVWRIPGDAFLTAAIGVRGSLQTGSSPTIFGGQLGFTFAPSDCRVETVDNSGEVILIGPGATTSFVLTLRDGTTIDVPASSPPGLPTYAVGAVQVSSYTPDGSWPQDDSAQCVGGSA